MKRVFLSIGIGFALVIGYAGIMVGLFAGDLISRAASEILVLPVALPRFIPQLFLSHDEVLRRAEDHPVLSTIYVVVFDTILYSIPVYIILRLFKRKPAAVTTEPPPPPEFE